MIELVFIACLKTNPEACEQKILSYVEEGVAATPGGCLLRAQPELAIWVREHPAFTVASWRCEESPEPRIDI
jgi:hypothetical protein